MIKADNKIINYVTTEEKPNQPPSFSSCVGPASEEYFADLGTTTAIVTWNAPIASDPEDGSITYVVNSKSF